MPRIALFTSGASGWLRMEMLTQSAARLIVDRSGDAGAVRGRAFWPYRAAVFAWVSSASARLFCRFA